MKRLPGVIAAAILLILFSLYHLLLTGLIFFAAYFIPLAPASPGAPPTPAWFPWMACAFGVLLTGFAAWGIATAIGLFLVKRWARISILIIGGLTAAFALVSIVSMLAGMALAIVAPSSTAPSQTEHLQSTMPIVFGVLAIVYTIPLALGIWWLVYFNLRRVREVFAAASGPVEPNRRPLLISILAVLCLIGLPSCVAIALLPIPAAFFGLVLHGPQKYASYFLFAALDGAAGYGLWSLKEWGRRVALILQGLGIVNAIVFILQPSLLTGYTNEVNSALGLPQPYSTQPLQTPMIAISMGISLVLLIAVVFVLHYYRLPADRRTTSRAARVPRRLTAKCPGASQRRGHFATPALHARHAGTTPGKHVNGSVSTFQ